MRTTQNAALSVETLNALLSVHQATTLVSFSKAARRCLHQLLPLRSATVIFRPLEFRVPLIFSEAGEQKHWRQWAGATHKASTWFKDLQLSPRRRVLRLSDCPPDSQQQHSRIWRKLLAPDENAHGALLVVWEKGVPLAFIQVLRGAGEGDFSDAEMHRLTAVYPQFAIAVRRLFRLQRERSLRFSLERLVSKSAVPVLLLDWQLRVRYRTPGAQGYCMRWAQTGPGQAAQPRRAFRLPREVWTACDKLRTICWRDPLFVCRRGISLPPRRESLRSICHIECVRGFPPSEPHFLVRFENGQPGAITPSQLWQRLTAREREITALVCAGHSNAQIARQLFKSIATVRNQLHSVFEKLNVKTRSQLLPRLGWKT